MWLRSHIKPADLVISHLVNVVRLFFGFRDGGAVWLETDLMVEKGFMRQDDLLVLCDHGIHLECRDAEIEGALHRWEGVLRHEAATTTVSLSIERSLHRWLCFLAHV